MASSRRRRSKEKKGDNSKARVETKSDENRKNRKNSKTGCYGKKRKNKTYSNNNNLDSTDTPYRYQASAPNPAIEKTSASNINDQHGIGTNYERRNNLDVNQGDSRSSYHYQSSGLNQTGETNPVAAPRKNVQHHISEDYARDNNSNRLNHSYIHQGNLENSFRKQYTPDYSNRYKSPVTNIETGPIKGSNRYAQDEVNEVFEKKEVTRGNRNRSTKDSNSAFLATTLPSNNTKNHDQYRRYKRSSIVSKVSSEFSSGSSFRKNNDRLVHSVDRLNLKDHRSFSTSAGNKSGRINQSYAAIETSYGSLANPKHVHNEKKPIPVLKANKSYNISFAMNSQSPAKNVSSVTHKETKPLEYVESNKAKKLIRKKSSKRIQTVNGSYDMDVLKQAEAFSPLMKDVNYNERKDSNALRMTRGHYEMTDGNNGLARNYKVNNCQREDSGALRMAKGNYDMADRDNGMARHSNGNAGGNNNSMHDYSYRTPSNNFEAADNNNLMPNNNYRSTSYSYGLPNKNSEIGDAVYTTESMTYKEWLEIEHPDGKREKREYKRERNEDGDLIYIDILNGNVLKMDQADWKSGEELIKTKKGTEKVRYEWRKDNGTNEWIKYNADTNEILKKGDWKSGSEWYRNSKGKFVQRNYTYIKGSDGRWVKSDSQSGIIIDYSNCAALKGHNWVPTKKSGYGKTKNGKWKKQEYQYIQNNKGKWLKQDPETKKKLEKPSRTGWKEGKEYNMDDNGKVKKVKYVWETKPNGMMTKVDKKTKEPINTTWKQGREIIMHDNNVVTNNYSWVKNGKNKWVKVDEETGKPLTNNIRSNKISTYNQSESKSKAFVTKTSKVVENNKIVEENTKIEQDGGTVLKNTSTTIKY